MLPITDRHIGTIFVQAADFLKGLPVSPERLKEALQVLRQHARHEGSATRREVLDYALGAMEESVEVLIAIGERALEFRVEPSGKDRLAYFLMRVYDRASLLGLSQRF